ncbi:hypothetical protein [Bradyrhizobium sp. I71]|uniref:hypothetical protein n=1 Tax=Bradyrhizobium sp. I71 TaxID=2590772 RepID=UPI001EF7FC2E|nr:hypothetical protein [Bradyrhizobium sp. I71]ULK98848.1 hypothetical protein FJV43_03635 [Bradyrhizobium sp. I71]
MATQILAVGTNALSSSDVTVTSGSSLTVALKGDNGARVNSGAVVKIELKADDGNYYEVGELSGYTGKTGTMIDAPGTYRFSRIAGGACGVFSA